MQKFIRMLNTSKNSVLIENIVLILISVFMLTEILYMLYYNSVDWTFLNFLIIVRYSSMLILLLRILINFFVKKESIKVIVLEIVILLYAMFVSYFANKYYLRYLQNQFLSFCIMQIAVKDINYKKIVNAITISLLIAIIIILLLGLINVTQVYIPNWAIEFNLTNSRVRMLWGIHPGPISSFIMFFVFSYVYIKGFKFNYYDFACLTTINIIQFYVFGTKFSAVLTEFFLLLVILIISFGLVRRIIDNISIMIITLPIFSVVISFLLCIYYDSQNHIFSVLNSVLSGRLYLASEKILNSQISLFGNDIIYQLFSAEWIKNPEAYYNEPVIDMGYINIYYRYGIITLLLYIVLITFFAYIIYKRKDTLLAVIFAIVVLFTIYNDPVFEIEYSFFFFVWAYYNSSRLN